MITLSVIIPVYNEEKTLDEIVQMVLDQESVTEVILVNDGSKDNSSTIMNDLAKSSDKVKIVDYKTNRGKGYALRQGFKIASCDYIIIQDADLEYNPSQFTKLIAGIKNKGDIVYGSRFLDRSLLYCLTTMKMTFKALLANKVLTNLTNFIFKSSLTDMETCYKLFPAELVKADNFKSEKFEIEVELTAKLLKSRLAIKEVSIEYFARTSSEGKKIGFSDFLLAIKYILIFR